MVNKNTFSHTISLKYDGMRFAIAGILNTALTLLIYQLGLLFVSHLTAYAFSWLIGIIFLVTVYPSRVFPGADHNITSKALIVMIYLSSFGASSLVLDYLVTNYLAANLSIFIVLVFSTGLNFILMRLVLRQKLI